MSEKGTFTFTQEDVESNNPLLNEVALKLYRELERLEPAKARNRKRWKGDLRPASRPDVESWRKDAVLCLVNVVKTGSGGGVEPFLDALTYQESDDTPWDPEDGEPDPVVTPLKSADLLTLQSALYVLTMADLFEK